MIVNKQSVLWFKEISAGYGNVQILNNIFVEVKTDEIVAILGPNGSGKSTLVKTAMGLTTIYQGEIHWNGSNITRLSPHERARRGLGYVPQVENVFTSLTVFENLEMGGYLLSKKQILYEIEHIYNLFPMLKKRCDVKAGSLSGGERRMLAIGSCLVGQPRFLLLDEPSSDLAPAMIDIVFEKIKQIHKEYHIPILMVEQNVPRAKDISDRIYVLVRGQVRLESRAESVTEEELGNLFLEIKEAT